MGQDGEELVAAWCLGKGGSPHIQGTQGVNISLCPHPGGMLCAWSVGARSSPKRVKAGTGEEQGTALWQRA